MAIFRIHNVSVFAFGPGWVNTSGDIWQTNNSIATRSFDCFAGDTLELGGIDVGGINDVPPGFRVLTAGWNLHADNSPFVAGMPVARVSTGSDASDNHIAGALGDFANNYPGTITAIELFTDELHAEFDVTGPDTRVAAYVGNSASAFAPSGTYDIVNFSFTVDPASAVIGDTITIGATDSLDEVDNLHITWIDPVSGEVQETIIPAASFVTQTPTSITFILSSAYIPSDFAGDVMIWGDGNGVQFSGTIALGVLAILIADGSGIYRIIDGQTHDTVYISAASGDDTENVAIPDPFFRTGFLGG